MRAQMQPRFALFIVRLLIALQLNCLIYALQKHRDHFSYDPTDEHQCARCAEVCSENVDLLYSDLMTIPNASQHITCEPVISEAEECAGSDDGRQDSQAMYAAFPPPPWRAAPKQTTTMAPEYSRVPVPPVWIYTYWSSYKLEPHGYYRGIMSKLNDRIAIADGWVRSPDEPPTGCRSSDSKQVAAMRGVHFNAPEDFMKTININDPISYVRTVTSVELFPLGDFVRLYNFVGIDWRLPVVHEFAKLRVMPELDTNQDASQNCLLYAYTPLKPGSEIYAFTHVPVKYVSKTDKAELRKLEIIQPSSFKLTNTGWGAPIVCNGKLSYIAQRPTESGDGFEAVSIGFYYHQISIKMTQFSNTEGMGELLVDSKHYKNGTGQTNARRRSTVQRRRTNRSRQRKPAG